MRANTTELAHRSQPSKDSPIVNSDVPRQSGCIGHDNMVAKVAVVRHMGESHQQAVLTHHGLARSRSAFVHCRRLTHSSAIANIAIGGFTFVLQILWNGRDNCAWENLTILADARAVHDDSIGTNPRAAANLHVFANPCESLNLYIFCDAGIRVNIS